MRPIGEIPLETPAVGRKGDAGGGDRTLAAAFTRLAAGDLGSLDDVYDACANQLYSLAFWRTRSLEDAADAVQDVFVSLAAVPARLTRVRKPRAYLLAMAHSAAVKIVRRRRATVEADDTVLQPVFHDPGVGVDAARAAAVMRRLSPRQCEVVYLRHFVGLTFAEIGDVTGVPTFTAASRYRLGINRLRQLIGVKR